VKAEDSVANNVCITGEDLALCFFDQMFNKALRYMLPILMMSENLFGENH
jgi:hypothetical protein